MLGAGDGVPRAAHLRYCDAAFLCQLFFGFFTGVGVTEVGVKILVQDFCGLFTEVTPFPPETREENHSCSSRCTEVSGRVGWVETTLVSRARAAAHGSTTALPAPTRGGCAQAGLCPTLLRPHVRAGAEKVTKGQAGTEPGSTLSPSLTTRPPPAAGQLRFCTAVWGERGGEGRAAPPLCPHVALTELIGFCQPVSGFQGFAREPHLCTLLPRAAQGRALVARGTVPRCAPSPESKASWGTAPGTRHSQPSGARGAAQPLRHSHSPLRAHRAGYSSGSCGAVPPSPGGCSAPQNVLWKALNISCGAPCPSGLVAIKLPAPEASSSERNPQRSPPALSPCC